MGCSFFSCFSASNNKKHQHLVDGASSIDQKPEANEAVRCSKEEDFWKPFNPIIVKKEKLGELLKNNSDKEKVAFDLNVETHEELYVEQSSDKSLTNEENKEIEGIVKGSGSSVLDLSAWAVVCESQNHRYQNSQESGDELKDLDLETKEVNEDDNGIGKAKNELQLDIEESSESLFSLSIESRKHVCEVESDEKEVNSPIPILLNRDAGVKGDECVQSVLNPVENLAQWKGVKAKAGIPLKDEEKENINVEQGSDFKLRTSSSRLCSNGKKLVGQEIDVDTSLSSWLMGPENTPNSKGSTNSVGNSAASLKTNSPRSYEDRPVLGALMQEELKQHSASTSSKKCRSQIPDETPIIGTVGSYWNHTGQIVNADSSSPRKGTPRTRSRNIQEQRTKWNAIPFEARLERALDIGAAGV
ncbi:Detected protein of unknown function [Hibiscus syriacus]|uniref:Uncharacterized protein n=1 Tax=Hibiscus syriacus TaxID=106335 RepID=A0A6A2YY50_HIBSY|nr:uncharacterized protein LOC120154772 [Hibiscus syriacus]KAE8684217.1 Detected protein of unknown function [Hibiscus syriacus]